GDSARFCPGPDARDHARGAAAAGAAAALSGGAVHGVVRFHRAGRSAAGWGADGGLGRAGLSSGWAGAGVAADLAGPRSRAHRMSLPMAPGAHGQAAAQAALRSEEHTSELQSRENLVCRLLLEKKK